MSLSGQEPTTGETAKAAPDNLGIRVLIAVPCHDSVPTMFSFDLARLFGTLAVCAEHKVIQFANLGMLTGTYVPRARQELAEAALKGGFSHIMWLDGDMRFPGDVALKLLEHDKEIVGINYSTRAVPPLFTALKRIGDREKGIPALKCVTMPNSTGLEEVDAVGFGALLMKTSILKRLHEPMGRNGHWFQTRWDDETQMNMGEDVWFCRLARRAGAKVYVDHDLSKLCAHIGSLEYTVEHAQDHFTLLNMPDPGKDA